MLMEIVKIVMSKSISYSATFVLKALIKDHHEHFCKVFPDKPLTPKQHFMVHYPRIIRQLGPLHQYLNKMIFLVSYVNPLFCNPLSDILLKWTIFQNQENGNLMCLHCNMA